MVADPTRYPFQKTTDCRSAMAGALRDFVKAQEFSLPKSVAPFQFAAVYSTWATFNDTATTAGGKLPAAAILPDRPAYEASELGPRMLEETWSGGDPDACKSDGTKIYPIGDGSGDGFALFTIAEMVVPFVLVVRASTGPMRKAIVSVLEDAFVEDGSLPDPSSLNPKIPSDVEVRPIRYGRLLSMPAYYSRIARFTLLSQQLMDTEGTAMENRWMAQLEIQGHAKVCVPRRVRAMRPRVELVADGEATSR